MKPLTQKAIEGARRALEPHDCDEDQDSVLICVRAPHTCDSERVWLATVDKLRAELNGLQLELAQYRRWITEGGIPDPFAKEKS